MKKILVTGSCGFIFSNFMRKVMQENLQYEFVSVDKVISSYNRPNVILNKDHNFYMGDIADEQFMNNVFAIEKPDIVIHGAAESFVDDSIKSAGPFIHSNVVGTQVMTDMAVKYGVERFIYVSTDEVYGQLKDIKDLSWIEDQPICPRNPYSASKASGELIVKAANQTHGLNYNITRSCNNYGPNQPPRNLVPKVITCAMRQENIPIHGNGKNYREWLYVEDHCDAIMKIANNAPMNETYNIGSGIEKTNLEMVNEIGLITGFNTKIKFIPDRAGHDFRYSVDCSKIRKLGWEPQYTFEKGLSNCIQWYLTHPQYFK